MWSFFTKPRNDDDRGRVKGANGENIDGVRVSAYTTSAELTKDHPEDPGVCSQFGNLYTKYQMGFGKDNFMFGRKEEIYADALKERAHQEKLRAQGEDYLHSSFVDANVVYDVKVHPPTVVKDGATLQETCKKGPNSLITYPVPTPPGKNLRGFHQLAVGLNKEEDFKKCYVFNPNEVGFVKKGPCDQMYDLAAKTIRENMLPTGGVIIATNEADDEPGTSPGLGS